MGRLAPVTPQAGAALLGEPPLLTFAFASPAAGAGGERAARARLTADQEEEEARAVSVDSSLSLVVAPLRLVYVQQLTLETVDYVLSGVLGTLVNSGADSAARAVAQMRRSALRMELSCTQATVVLPRTVWADDELLTLTVGELTYRNAWRFAAPVSSGALPPHEKSVTGGVIADGGAAPASVLEQGTLRLRGMSAMDAQQRSLLADVQLELSILRPFREELDARQDDGGQASSEAMGAAILVDVSCSPLRVRLQREQYVSLLNVLFDNVLAQRATMPGGETAAAATAAAPASSRSELASGSPPPNVSPPVTARTAVAYAYDADEAGRPITVTVQLDGLTVELLPPEACLTARPAAAVGAQAAAPPPAVAPACTASFVATAGFVRWERTSTGTATTEVSLRALHVLSHSTKSARALLAPLGGGSSGAGVTGFPQLKVEFVTRAASEATTLSVTVGGSAVCVLPDSIAAIGSFFEVPARPTLPVAPTVSPAPPPAAFASLSSRGGGGGGRGATSWQRQVSVTFKRAQFELLEDLAALPTHARSVCVHASLTLEHASAPAALDGSANAAASLAVVLSDVEAYLSLPVPHNVGGEPGRALEHPISTQGPLSAAAGLLRVPLVAPFTARLDCVSDAAADGFSVVRKVRRCLLHRLTVLGDNLRRQSSSRFQPDPRMSAL